MVGIARGVTVVCACNHRFVSPTGPVVMSAAPSKNAVSAFQI